MKSINQKSPDKKMNKTKTIEVGLAHFLQENDQTLLHASHLTQSPLFMTPSKPLPDAPQTLA
jgi:hypothetical protein